MIRRLRRRLLCIFTIATGLVLTLVVLMVAAFNVMEALDNQKREMTFWLQSSAEEYAQAVKEDPTDQAADGINKQEHSDPWVMLHTFVNRGQAASARLTTNPIAQQGLYNIITQEFGFPVTIDGNDSLIIKIDKTMPEFQFLSELIDENGYTLELFNENEWVVTGKNQVQSFQTPSVGRTNVDALSGKIDFLPIAPAQLYTTGPFESLFSVEKGSPVILFGRWGELYVGGTVNLYGYDGAGTVLQVQAFQKLRLSDLGTRDQLASYIIIELVGLVLLWLVGWWVVRKAVRPVEEGLRQQKEFIAAASHELKSPLAVIELNASAITCEPDKAQKYTSVIASECRRMGKLVGDLLFFASGDAKGWKNDASPLVPDTLLIELYDSFTPLFQQKQVGFSLVLPESSLPSVRADAERLKQALTVLLDNALRYAPPGTSVCLFAAAAGRWVQLGVEDHGPGIPDAEKQQVLRRFYRSDHSRTDKSHFGLGLSIADEIIRMSGGSLLLSDTPGGGCTVVAYLPASRNRNA